MNINKLTTGVGGGGSPRETAKPEATAKAPTENTGSKVKTEDVTLSQQGKSIQQIESEVSKLPEIDDASVERIKAALANNEYKIEYERLAGKMIKFDGMLK